MIRSGHIARELHAPNLGHLTRPVHLRKESFLAGTRILSHQHPWDQLVYASAGVLWVRTPVGDHLAPPQRAVWLPPEVDHEVIASEATEMRSLYLDREMTGLGVDRCTVFEIPSLVRELIHAFEDFPAEYDVDGAQGRLVQVLVDCLSLLVEVPFSLPLPQDPRLARICASLQERVDDTRSLPSWARAVGMSERSLTRAFRRETGLSFHVWRHRLRLLWAMAAMERCQSVTATALDSGYASIPAFVAAFRAMFGQPPAAFIRDRNREK